MQPPADRIQADGNKFLFIEVVYAQQVLSCIGMLITVILVIYLNVVVRRMYKPDALLRTDDYPIGNSQSEE